MKEKRSDTRRPPAPDAARRAAYIQQLRGVIDGQQELLRAAGALLYCMAVRAGEAKHALDGGGVLRVPKAEVTAALRDVELTVRQETNDYCIGFARRAEEDESGAPLA